MTKTTQEEATISPLLLRIGLIGAGALALRISHSLMLGDAPLIRHPQFVWWLVVTGALGLSLWGLAGLGSRIPRRAVWLVLVVCLLDIFLRFDILQMTADTPYFVNSHEVARVDFAARLLADGENPYTWDYAGVYTLYDLNAPPRLIAQEHLALPPLGIVLATPLEHAGLSPLPALSALTYGGMIVLIFFASPLWLRPVIVLPFFVADELLFSQMVVSGSMSLLWTVAFAVCALMWRNRIWRGLAFGVALALHPLAWLALPPTLLRVWREDGFSGARYFLLIAFALFGVVNLPFVLWNFGAWMDSVSAVLQINPVIYLRPLAGLPVLQPAYFVFALIVLYVLMLWLYGRHFAFLRHVCWVFPALMTTLSPYPALELWLFCALPVVMTFLATSDSEIITPQKIKWRGSMAVASGVLASVLLVGLVAFRSESTLILTPNYPLFTDANGRIETISVQLQNEGGQSLTPRFYVHPRFEADAVRWRILDGPAELAGGESADFVIQPIDDDGGFFVGAEITAFDADGQFSEPLMFGDFEDYSFPDNIFNTNFQLWTQGSAAPNGWTLDSNPAGRIRATMRTHDGRSAVQLNLEAGSTPTLSTLTTTAPFPYTPLHLWLWRDAMDDAVTFGVEFDDGVHRIIYDFAADEDSTRLTSTTYRETRVIPVGEWSLQTIDLSAVYDAAGWDLPEFRATVHRELLLDWRLIDMSLILAGRSDDPITAYIGEIVQPLERVSPQRLMRESINNPANTYRRIAVEHLRMRNDDLALAALETALTYTPDDVSLQVEIDALNARIQQLNGAGTHE
ncbi:MAG: hypothetical protein RLP44_09010 [Aggregatilineales bacterium]